MKSKYLLKMYAGPYFYQEKKDSIGLRHSTSSYSGYKSYAYRIESNKLYIDDFYEKTNGHNQVLVFLKLK